MLAGNNKTTSARGLKEACGDIPPAKTKKIKPQKTTTK
jgi:hypothetical protein